MAAVALPTRSQLASIREPQQPPTRDPLCLFACLEITGDRSATGITDNFVAQMFGPRTLGEGCT